MSQNMDHIFKNVAWNPIPAPANNDGDMPYATHTGVLDIGGVQIECVVLNTGERLLTGSVIENLVAGLKTLS